MDPISYALEGLVPQQFHDESGPSSVNHTVVVYGAPPQDAYAYVSNLYDAHYEKRFASAGYLAIFVVGLQAFHLYATRFKQHIDR